MNCGMIRWKAEPLKCSGLPETPAPLSPVHSARKFSAVRGATPPHRSNTIRPASAPPIAMSKKTRLVGAGVASGGAQRRLLGWHVRRGRAAQGVADALSALNVSSHELLGRDKFAGRGWRA